MQLIRTLRQAIIDWVMPKVDGKEVSGRQIRSGPAEPYAYVVLLTAKDDNKSDIIAGFGRRRRDDYFGSSPATRSAEGAACAQVSG